MKAHHYKFDEYFIVNLIKDIQTDNKDRSSGSKLSYNRLIKLIDLYSKQPLRNKTDGNGSETLYEVMMHN